jgi:hypothetical protein
MRHAVLLLFIHLFVGANAQHVYLASTEPFEVLNSGDSTKVNALWLDLSAFNTAQIKLANGTGLKRTFPANIPKPYYVIEGDKIFYRPNVKSTQTDTVHVIPIMAEKIAVQDSVISPADSSEENWSVLISEIKLLEFEYEKSEKISEVLSSKSDWTCVQLKTLLDCLEYPQSKANILSAYRDKFPTACFNDLVADLPRALRKTIEKDE